MQQLELNLTTGAENNEEIVPWRYRFAKNALIEEFDEIRFVYGLWETLFGCWIVDPTRQRSTEVIPTWQPLNQNGIWRDQREVRFPHYFSSGGPISQKWRYEANAAFAGYFSGIPQVARTLVASFEHLQWLGLGLIWNEARFAQFLDDELFNDKEQFIFSCCALADATQKPRSWRHEFVTALMTEQRVELLGRLTDLPCSNATLRAIYKLGSAPCSKEVYQGLIYFINDNPTSKVFSHANQIHAGLINVLEQLPHELLQTNIVNILLRDLDLDSLDDESPDGTLGILFGQLAGLFSLAPTKLKSAMTDSFGQARDLEQLIKYKDRWEPRIIETIEFPAPPVQTLENLIPLSSAAAMREESRLMQNCLANMITFVLQERVYFFHWSGSVPATVMFENTEDQGWQFCEALGVKNEPIPEEIVEGICSCYRPW